MFTAHSLAAESAKEALTACTVEPGPSCKADVFVASDHGPTADADCDSVVAFSGMATEQTYVSDYQVQPWICPARPVDNATPITTRTVLFGRGGCMGTDYNMRTGDIVGTPSESGGFEIRKDSAAFKRGVKLGWRILKVNDVDFSHMAYQNRDRLIECRIEFATDVQ